MNGKKILPLFVIASMMLSLLPSMMFAHALSTPDLADVDGNPVVSGVKGNKVVVTGTVGEIPAGTTVQLYWDDSTIAWNGVKGLLNSTKAEADGNYEVWFDVPQAVTGDHYLWVRTTLGGIADVASIVFVVEPSIKLSPSSGLAGDTVTTTMYGYPKTADMTITFNGVDKATATTNSVGTATATFKVPTIADGLYPVVASNTTWPGGVLVAATEDFTVGPVITLSASSGTVGTVISITGRGFSVGDDIVQGDVTINGHDCYITTALPLTVDATQRIRLNVVIPQTDDTNDYTLILDSVAGYAEADFEVTALAKVSVTPGYGPVASTITVSGVNYPKIKDITITIELNGPIAIGTVKTLADGTFSKTFKVPAAAEDTYDLAAYTIDYDIADTASFKVGTMNILASDDSGATGTTINLSGNGFTAGNAWNATFGSKTIIDAGVVGGTGLLTGGSFQVPQLPVGTYTITVTDVNTEISLTTQFKITQTTSVTLGASTAPNEFNVTLRGYGFSDAVGGDPVDFVLYNKTSTGASDFWYTIAVVQSPWEGAGVAAYTNDTGEFYGWWQVNPSDILSKGNYYINITDSTGDYAVTVPFTIGDVHAVCTPRKPSFAIGETISFTMEHSFGGIVDSVADGSYLKIYNPSGTLVYAGDTITTADWVKTGDYYTAPYSAQTAGGNPMTLRDDAPTGTWAWKWFGSDAEVITSGTITVTASAVSATDAKIAALATQITALQGTVTTAITGAQTAATAAGTAATAAGAKADAATVAATAAGTKADAATAAATSAAASAKSAADAANGLTTLVYAAIGASLVAALAAIVALMQISRKIA